MKMGFQGSVKQIRKEIPSVTDKEIEILKEIYEQIEQFVINVTTSDYDDSLLKFKEKIKEILSKYNDEKNLLKKHGLLFNTFLFYVSQNGWF